MSWTNIAQLWWQTTYTQKSHKIKYIDVFSSKETFQNFIYRMLGQWFRKTTNQWTMLSHLRWSNAHCRTLYLSISLKGISDTPNFVQSRANANIPFQLCNSCCRWLAWSVFHSQSYHTTSHHEQWNHWHSERYIKHMLMVTKCVICLKKCWCSNSKYEERTTNIKWIRLWILVSIPNSFSYSKQDISVAKFKELVLVRDSF